MHSKFRSDFRRKVKSMKAGNYIINLYRNFPRYGIVGTKNKE